MTKWGRAFPRRVVPRNLQKEGRSRHALAEDAPDLVEHLVWRQRVGVELTLAQLRRALLIFHSPRDEIVGIDNAARLFGAAHHPKSFVSLDDADHLLSRREDSLYVGTVLAAWARKYLGMLPEDQPPALIPDNHVVVRTGRTGNGLDGNGHYYRLSRTAKGWEIVVRETWMSALPNKPVEQMAARGRCLHSRSSWTAASAHFSHQHVDSHPRAVGRRLEKPETEQSIRAATGRVG